MKLIKYILPVVLLYSCFQEETEPESSIRPAFEQQIENVKNEIVTTTDEINGASFIFGEQPENLQPSYVLLSPFKIMKKEVNNEQFVTFLTDVTCSKNGTLFGKQLIDLSDTTITASLNEAYNLIEFSTSQPTLAVRNITWHGANQFAKWCNGKLATEAELTYYLSTQIDQLSEGEEWCFDWYAENIDSDSIRVNPNGASSGAYKVITKKAMNHLDRDKLQPDSSRNNLGFRIVWNYTDSIDVELPEIETNGVVALSSTTITIRSVIKDDGGDIHLTKGVVYDTLLTPSFQQCQGIIKSDARRDTFALMIVGLKPQHTYFIRSFAINAAGVDFGNTVEVQTNDALLGLGSGNLDLEMVTIEAAQFNMGNNGEPGIPEHNVYLDAFQISKFEITVLQYCAFANSISIDAEGNLDGQHYFNPSEKFVTFNHSEGFIPKSGFENYPISRVTWLGANAFCSWAGGALPSEAQWEFAAKGFKDTDYSGSAEITNAAWYFENSTNPDLTLIEGKALHAVGQKQANAFGIHDMSGNVYEWCSDYFHVDYYLQSINTNPMGPSLGDEKVIRGGSFINDEYNCRVYTRSSQHPHNKQSNYMMGFRMTK